MKPRTLYIVDDNQDFLDSTGFWLGGAGYDVHTWSDPEAAVEGLVARDRSLAACLLLDIRMPRLWGLGVHDALLQRGAALPVIYMSGHADVALAVQAMRKGAVTLLEKPFDDETLEAALQAAFAAPARTVAAGEGGTQPEAASAAPIIGGCAHNAFATREARLTPRERQVLALVTEGIYNKNIADRIGLSIKTVELYRARGMAKMQVRSVAELTRMMVTRQA